ncbi:type II secretion system F family protein [Ornithinimicrobium sp. W1679]|uniref:type II secretion system F family protein n=1 Tax=Ornithinimicrobium sp. W1679 TaxID=3418770 RepID=UPI003CE7D643
MATPTRGPVLVAEALELIALALQGGGSVAQALRTVGAVIPGPPGRELQDVATALHRGEDPDEAWGSVDACWTPGARSLRLAQAAGVAPGEALVGAARDLRREAVADVEVGAARLGVRLVVPLGLAYLPAFVLITVVPVVLALTRDLTW